MSEQNYDVELSCAGTMVAAKRSGKRTAIVDLTRGELSTRGTLELRAKETEAATKILQLDHRENLGMADGNIELSQPNLFRLIAAIRKYRPTILLTPHSSERHPDHEAASELAHRAVFYAGLSKMETKDADGEGQKPHRPLLALQYMQTYVFEPTIIIDVTAVFETRLDAMRAYDSQFARPRSTNSRFNTGNETAQDKMQNEPETYLSQAGFYEWIEARARHYGMSIGVEFGEPFFSRQPLGTKDVFQVVTKRVA
jgi:bacillithiol biosynthesis deacetylase BshB1